MRPDDIATLALAGLIGAGLGALAMYLLDPDTGRRRRALARERARRLASEATETVQDAARELRDRAEGLARETAGKASNVMPWTGPDRRKRPRGNGSKEPTGAE